ncbi:MAG: hypothetical protein ACKV22_06710 [Bryobacteraceae bacterium]
MQQPVLTDEEWALLMEMLDHERVKLLTEIRRTDTMAFRQELRERLEMVDRIVEKAVVPSS